MMRHGGRHLCDGDGPDLTKVATYTGVVKSFTGGAGEGFPTLVLTTSAGEVSIVLSPYRALLQAGYTPVAGAQVEVKAAPVSVDGVEHWVALSVTDRRRASRSSCATRRRACPWPWAAAAGASQSNAAVASWRGRVNLPRFRVVGICARQGPTPLRPLSKVLDGK